MVEGVNNDLFSRFVKKSLANIQHYEDWKDRRRAFEPAFTRRCSLNNCNSSLILIITVIFVVLFQSTTLSLRGF